MSGLRLCECGGLPKVQTRQVAEDAVETWVACNRCPIRTEEIEDAYPDYGTAEWQWNRGDVHNPDAALTGETGGAL